MRLQRSARAILLLATAAAWVVLPGAVAAHSHVEVGNFHLTVGWGDEPTLAGQPNEVDILVTDHDEKPVVDLAADALSVVVSTAGQDSQKLSLGPAFDVEEGFGTPGKYAADLMPTVPGEYTFHITGSIHGQAVDVSITSGEDTFSSVESSSDFEFPVKLPGLADVATRLDRIDGRLQTLAGLQTSAAEARDAADAASRTAQIGLVVGGAGLVTGALGLWLALRARRGTAAA
jgi:hypothetical protein